MQENNCEVKNFEVLEILQLKFLCMKIYIENFSFRWKMTEKCMIRWFSSCSSKSNLSADSGFVDEARRTSSTSAVYDASFVFELRTSISKTRSLLFYENNFSVRFYLFESERWSRFSIALFFEFLENIFDELFLMIRGMIHSVKMILQISVHSTFARMRISLLIAEMSIFELIETKAKESRLDCLHWMIFLAVMLIVSLLEIFTWIKIQWMWISRSHLSILRVNVCNKY
jgi:hypothetical protein